LAKRQDVKRAKVSPETLSNSALLCAFGFVAFQVQQ
jgi:hypothetical protein